MTENTVTLLKEALLVLLAVSMPALLVGLVVGVLTSLLQAATQIQEQSLTFIPKLFAVAGTLWLTAPWSADKLVTFFQHVMAAVAASGAAASGSGLVP